MKQSEINLLQRCANTINDDFDDYDRDDMLSLIELDFIRVEKVTERWSGRVSTIYDITPEGREYLNDNLD